jgi:hypothetical protein
MPKQTDCQGSFLQRQMHNNWTVVRDTFRDAFVQFSKGTGHRHSLRNYENLGDPPGSVRNNIGSLETGASCLKSDLPLMR